MEQENFKNYQSAIKNFCLRNKHACKNHNINLEQYECDYQAFYVQNHGFDFERDICKQFENADFEGLMLFENFIKE